MRLFAATLLSLFLAAIAGAQIVEVTVRVTSQDGSSVDVVSPVTPPKPSKAGTSVHVVVDKTRPNSPATKDAITGDGSSENPYNCIDNDSLRLIVDSDECVPPGSRLLLGPGTYNFTGIASYGILVLKDLDIVGAGRGSTVLRFVNGLPSSAASADFSFKLIGMDYAPPYTGNHRISVSDLTLDANFDGFIETQPHDSKITQGAISSVALQSTVERVDVIGCGEHEKFSESFHLFFDNRVTGSAPREVTLRDVHFHSESDGPANIKVSPVGGAGAAAIHLGGNPREGGGVVNGTVDNCKVHRSYEGVCFGIASVNSLVISNNVQTRDAAIKTTSVLHDTGSAKIIQITGNTFNPGPYNAALVDTFQGEFTSFRDNVVVREQRQVQGSIRVGNKKLIRVDNNFFGGTGVGGVTPIIESIGTPPANVVHARGNSVDPASGITQVIFGSAPNELALAVSADNRYLNGAAIPD